MIFIFEMWNINKDPEKHFREKDVISEVTVRADSEEEAYELAKTISQREEGCLLKINAL